MGHLQPRPCPKQIQCTVERPQLSLQQFCNLDRQAVGAWSTMLLGLVLGVLLCTWTGLDSVKYAGVTPSQATTNTIV